MKTIITLPSGVKLSISARFVEFEYATWDNEHLHPHYKITIRANGKTDTFNFWDSFYAYQHNKQQLNHNELIEAVLSYINDAMCGSNPDLFDFASELGYDLNDRKQYERANQAYGACKRAKRHLNHLFDEDLSTLYEQLSNILEQ